MAPTMASCPLCEACHPILELQAHVNRCLDLMETLEIPSPPPSECSTEEETTPDHPSLFDSPESKFTQSQSQSQSEPNHETKPESQPEVRLEQTPEQQTPIGIWLSNLGLSKYTPHILRAGFRTLADILSAPSPADTLREHGVLALGARRKLASEISALRGHAPPQAPIPLQTAQPPKKKRSVWASFFSSSSAPTKRTSENFTFPRLAKRPRTRKPQNPQHRYSQRVPGTSFTVDSFSAARGDPQGSIYFLTHFHSDHYGGLRQNVLPGGSRVVCSAVTARLVRSELRVPEEFITVVPLEQEMSFGGDDGVSAWFFDANHCPGAIVILFFVRRTKRWVLHTGDCRFDRSVFSKHEKLVEVIQGRMLDYLHLDTTYCNAQYVFPPQAEVLDNVVRAAQEEDTRTKGRCLYFFGTYSIGKEKVFLAVAKALNLRIYTGKRKRSLLEKLDLEDLKSRLAEKPSEARVHVVSMRALKADGLRAYAVRNELKQDFIGRGLAIVFRPTGWAFRGNGQGFRKINRSADQAMVYEVPYSEHSSFDELVDFVKWAKPARVVPTVNARSREQADNLRMLLGHKERSLRIVT